MREHTVVFQLTVIRLLRGVLRLLKGCLSAWETWLKQEREMNPVSPAERFSRPPVKAEER